MVSDEALHLASKIPDTEQIFAGQLHGGDLNTKRAPVTVTFIGLFHRPTKQGL